MALMPSATAVDAAGPVQRAILELFFIILILSLVIGVLVHVVLLWAVKWYRDRPQWQPPKGLPRTHDRRLEVGWTIGPVVILAAVAILTMAALPAIERPPAFGHTNQMNGSQVVRVFQFPDWNGPGPGPRSSRTMYV